jgi:glutamyl-tRNA synthetase
MTIGNLRSALYEYLIAKRDAGVFILRLEDTDRIRYVEGAEEVIYDTLRRTGLVFDEGPQVGGGYGPYVQSERKATYLPPALDMVKNKKAYYCFCTPERLETLADARGLKKYDRFCLHMPAEEIAGRLSKNEPYVIRQLIPEGRTTFIDTVFGGITIENTEMEDQILLKSDGMPTYNFANVVDDHAMAITHVVRGSEYLTSTPKYVLLYEALGWKTPVFVHLPLLQNPDGTKISKRHGAKSIIELIDEGYLPQAIINYAAFLGWSPSGEYATREIFTLTELEQIFDTAHISKSPSTFDEKKLAWMNAEHIKIIPFKEYYDLALPFLRQAVKTPGADMQELARITQTRVQFVKECGALVDFIDALPEYDIELYTHKKMKTDAAVALTALKAAKETYATVSAENWAAEALQTAANTAAEASGLKNGQILWSVRTALSGKATTPCGASEIAVLLGREETLHRLAAGITKLSATA